MFFLSVFLVQVKIKIVISVFNQVSVAAVHIHHWSVWKGSLEYQSSIDGPTTAIDESQHSR